MTDCHLCAKDLNLAAYTDTAHHACSGQWAQRYDNELCVHCGNPTWAAKRAICDDCTPDSPYTGYAGP